LHWATYLQSSHKNFVFLFLFFDAMQSTR
jgi:hypothetical protein